MCNIVLSVHDGKHRTIQYVTTFFMFLTNLYFVSRWMILLLYNLICRKKHKHKKKGSPTKKIKFTYSQAEDNSENWRDFHEERRRIQRERRKLETTSDHKEEPVNNWSNNGTGQNEEVKVYLTSKNPQMLTLPRGSNPFKPSNESIDEDTAKRSKSPRLYSYCFQLSKSKFRQQNLIFLFNFEAL